MSSMVGHAASERIYFTYSISGFEVVLPEEKKKLLRRRSKEAEMKASEG